MDTALPSNTFLLAPIPDSSLLLDYRPQHAWIGDGAAQH